MGIRPVLNPAEQAARSLRFSNCEDKADNLDHWMSWISARYIELHTHYTCLVDAIRWRLEQGEYDKVKELALSALSPDQMEHFRYNVHETYIPPDFFQKGDFTLHSGQKSKYKIECDALTPGSWAAAAVMAVELLPPFGRVVGVPRGGLPFADALSEHVTPGSPVTLIAEDVVTTGGSMEVFKDKVVPHGDPYIGVALICRGKCPEWVVPVLTKTQPKVV